MPVIYRLVVEFAPACASALADSGAQVFLARCSAASDPSAIWLRFPVRSRSCVAWADGYGLYGGRLPNGDARRPALDAVVRRALPGRSYAFSGTRFGPGDLAPGTPTAHYEVRNDARTPALVGLLQAATLDGVVAADVVTASFLPAGFSADFAPVPRLHVWVGRGVRRFAFAPVVPSNALLISPAAGGRLHLRYDAGARTFVPQ